jgi:hypothetical protein
MSCAAFTILAFVLAHLSDQSKVNGLFTQACAVLAVVFFIVASYAAWKQQHDLYVVELAKTQRPEIKGEAYYFTLGNYFSEGLGPTDDQWINADLEFKFRVANHRLVRTNISGVEMEGSELIPPCTFHNIILRQDPRVNTEPPRLNNQIYLEHGESLILSGTARFEIRFVSRSDLKDIDVSKLKIRVFDGFGDPHSIVVRSGESIPLGRKRAK